MTTRICYSLLLYFSIIVTANAQLVGTGYMGPNGLTTLYDIDPVTGAATPIGPVGFERCSAVAVHPITGVLYGVCERADGSNLPVLLTIDPATGAGTEVGVPGNHSFGNAYAGLSFRSDGVLFAYLEPGDGVGTIDITTGALTELGPSFVSCCGNGIAFNATDMLFHANDNSLSTLGQVTGNATHVVPLTFPNPPAFSRISGMDFDDDSGILYGVNKEDGVGEFLSTIDVTTGVVTNIGMAGNNMDGLAFLGASAPATPIPTMSVRGLVILVSLLGLLGFIGFRYRLN